MARHSPRKPGWYAKASEPLSLLYWDGATWTQRTRPKPSWASRSEIFEPGQEEFDRSVEGPVHPHEVRERAAMGAWSREWFVPWRSRQPERSWQRGLAGHPSLLARPRGQQSPVLLRPARRPLAWMLCLVAVAATVVLTSVAVMTPYEARSPVVAANRQALARFAAEATRECTAALPGDRQVLASAVDGPAITAAAHQVQLLGLRLASIPIPKDGLGPVGEWLDTWKNFTSSQARYALIIGAAVRRDGRLLPRELTPVARREAVQVRRQAVVSATQADRFASGLGVLACRLEPGPAT